MYYVECHGYLKTEKAIKVFFSHFGHIFESDDEKLYHTTTEPFSSSLIRRKQKINVVNPSPLESMKLCMKKVADES